LIGVKEQVIVVYASYAKEVVPGAIRIATNEQIPVTIEDRVTTMDLGGYYVVHLQDLKAFVEAVKKAQ